MAAYKVGDPLPGPGGYIEIQPLPGESVKDACRRLKIGVNMAKPRVDVTDQMVQSGVEYCATHVMMTKAGPAIVRDFLEAVLNPPTPDVTVTEEMIIAGAGVALYGKSARQYTQEIYRAMRALEPGHNTPAAPAVDRRQGEPFTGAQYWYGERRRKGDRT